MVGLCEGNEGLWNVWESVLSLLRSRRAEQVPAVYTETLNVAFAGLFSNPVQTSQAGRETILSWRQDGPPCSLPSSLFPSLLAILLYCSIPRSGSSPLGMSGSHLDRSMTQKVNLSPPTQ